MHLTSPPTSEVRICAAPNDTPLIEATARCRVPRITSGTGVGDPRPTPSCDTSKHAPVSAAPRGLQWRILNARAGQPRASSELARALLRSRPRRRRRGARLPAAPRCIAAGARGLRGPLRPGVVDLVGLHLVLERVQRRRRRRPRGAARRDGWRGRGRGRDPGRGARRLGDVHGRRRRPSSRCSPCSTLAPGCVSRPCAR